MSNDAAYHLYDNMGTTLEKSYTGSGSTTQTGGYDCSAYRTLFINVSVSAVTTCQCILSIEMSPDGENYFPLYIWSDTSNSFKQIKFTLESTGDYCFHVPIAGNYFRVKVAYSSGTSLTIDDCQIGAKS